MAAEQGAWPDLNYDAWRDTAATLHLWTQIVGKVRLSLTPWINHSWQVPLYVTARGLGTSPMPYSTELLELEFDFIAHRLQVYREKTIPLLEYYAGREWMFAVDGTRSPGQVHEDIVNRLRKLAAFDIPD